MRPKEDKLTSPALPEEVEAALWRRHLEQKDTDARGELMNHYLPFARIIAAKLYAGRHHDQIEFDEYLQFATVGLISSLDRFDPSRGAQFKTYASRRMIGEVLDGLEFLSERQQQIRLRQRLAAERLQALKETAPQDGNPEQLFRYLADVGIGLALGYLLEGTGMVDSGEQMTVVTHYDGLEIKQLQRRIKTVLNSLPEREQKVIRYHYLQNIPFQEISEMLGVTKGRIAQIHRHALDLLRVHMSHTPICDIAW